MRYKYRWQCSFSAHRALDSEVKSAAPASSESNIQWRVKLSALGWLILPHFIFFFSCSPRSADWLPRGDLSSILFLLF